MLKKLIVTLFTSVTLALFMAMLHNNLLSMQVDFQKVGDNKLAMEYSYQYNAHAVSEKIDVTPLKKLNIKLYEGTSFSSVRKKDPRSLNQCINTVAAALKALPRDHTSGLKKLTLTFDPKARRGMAGGNRMEIRCTGMSDTEMTAVVVHEIGHVIDTGQNLIGSRSAGISGFYDGTIPLYNNDPSVSFYKMSFAAGGTVKKEVGNLDFVSRYSTSDPFEDFAETYTYYRLHGNAFRKLAATNKTLRMKYRFMKERVFDGQEFGIKNESVNRKRRTYDITQLKYEQEEFFTL